MTVRIGIRENKINHAKGIRTSWVMLDKGIWVIKVKVKININTLISRNWIYLGFSFEKGFHYNHLQVGWELVLISSAVISINAVFFCSAQYFSWNIPSKCHKHSHKQMHFCTFFTAICIMSVWEISWYIPWRMCGNCVKMHREHSSSKEQSGAASSLGVRSSLRVVSSASLSYMVTCHDTPWYVMIHHE